MIAATPPQVFDGGYWCVVLVVPDPEQGGKTPGVIPGQGWCAWYGTIGGVDYAVIRCPKPIIGIKTDTLETVDSVLSAAGLSTKPYGRIGGQ